MKTTTLRRSFVLLTASTAVQIFAQTAANPPGEVVALDKFQVTDFYTASYADAYSTLGTKTGVPIREIPQSVTVIGRKLIDEQQPANLEDVVRNVAGLTTVSRFGGRQDHLAIRGFEMGTNRNGLLRNGVQSVSRAQADVGNLDRVEILKGPSSILYGRVEVGGIINSVTRKPEPKPIATISASAASFSSYAASVDVSQPLGASLAGRLYVSSKDAESYRDFVNGERTIVNPTLRWKIAPDTELTFEYEGLWDRRLMDRGIVAYLPNGAQNTGADAGYVIPLPRSRFLGDPAFDHNKFMADTGWLTLHRRSAAWQFTSLNSAARGTETRVNSEPAAITTAATLASGIMTRSMVDGKTYQELYVTDNYGTFDYDTGAFAGKLTIGGAARKEIEDEARVSRRQAAINIYTLAVQPMPAGQTRYALIAQTSDYHSVTNTWALYASNRFDLGPQWKAFVRGRYESVKQHILNSDLRDAAGTIVTPRRTTDYRFKPFAPSAALVYQPDKQLSFYANYVESFSQQNDAFLAGTATKLETGEQYEAGMKSSYLGDRLISTLAVFQITKENMTISEAPGVFTPIGKARSEGFEVDFNARLAPGWNLIAAFSRLSAKTLRGGATPAQGSGTGAGGTVSGRDLAGAAPTTFSLWNSYEFKGGSLQGFTLAAGAFYVDRRAGNAAAQFYLPGYTRTDASIGFHVGRLIASLNVSNLFDKNYYLGARGASNIEPGTPRNFTLSAKYTF
jgi:iron complex outermembrane receptor protein